MDCTRLDVVRPLAFMALLVIALVAMNGCVSALGSRIVTEDTEIASTETEDRVELTSELVYRGEYSAETVQLTFEQKAQCKHREITTIETVETTTLPRRNALYDLTFPAAILVVSVYLLEPWKGFAGDTTPVPMETSHTGNFDPRMANTDGAAGAGAGVIVLGLLLSWAVGGVYALSTGLFHLSFPKTTTLDTHHQTGSWEPMDCDNQPVSNAHARVTLGESLLYDGTTAEDGTLRFGTDALREALDRPEFSDTPYLRVVLQGKFHEFRKPIDLPAELLESLDYGGLVE